MVSIRRLGDEWDDIRRVASMNADEMREVSDRARMLGVDGGQCVPDLMLDAEWMGLGITGREAAELFQQGVLRWPEDQE